MAGFLAKCQSVSLVSATPREGRNSESSSRRRHPTPVGSLLTPGSWGRRRAEERRTRLGNGAGASAPPTGSEPGMASCNLRGTYVRRNSQTSSVQYRALTVKKKDLFLLVRCHFLVSPQHRCRKANRVFFSLGTHLLVDACVLFLPFQKKWAKRMHWNRAFVSSN